VVVGVDEENDGNVVRPDDDGVLVRGKLHELS